MSQYITARLTKQYVGDEQSNTALTFITLWVDSAEVEHVIFLFFPRK